MAAPRLIMGDVPTMVDAGSPGGGPRWGRMCWLSRQGVAAIFSQENHYTIVTGEDHAAFAAGAILGMLK